MNYHAQSTRSSDNGFIYIASLKRYYYHLAVYSATTLKDYFPQAHITLFTHQDFVDETSKVFDNVITDIPIHYRTKMFGMYNTPYKKTIYIDADSFIAHKDIRYSHEELDDCDLFFGPVTQYTTADVAWAFMDKNMTIAPKYHGAVCGYHNTPLCIDFMKTWYEEYLKQITSKTWPYERDHDKKWKIFDMFTLWRMYSGRFPEFDRFQQLKIKSVSARFTTTAQHSALDKKNPIIHLVDSATWRKIPGFKEKMEESDNDKKFNIKNYPIGQFPLENN